MAGDIRLPNLVSEVRIDSKGVHAGLDNVTSSVRGAGKEFTGLQKSASGAIDGLTTSLTSNLGPASGQAKAALDGIGASALASGGMLKTAVAGGAVVAGAALAAFAIDGARQFVDLAGEIRNFQRASGASAEESSRFVAVLDDLGVSSEKGASAIFKLGRKVADGGADLEKFGIAVARNKDGAVDLTGTLLNAADAYAATSDPAKRAELAFAAFGKQGQELVPILEQGRTGLEAFFKGAESGRQIFSQADLDKARAFELQMDELQDTFRGLKLESGEVLLPLLTSLAQGGVAVLGLIRDFGGLIGTLDKITTMRPFNGHTEVLEKLKAKQDEAKGSGDGLKQTTREMAEAAKEAAIQHDAQAKAIERATLATLAGLSSQVGYESSVNRLRDNIADLDDKTNAYTEAVNTNGASSKEAESANRQLRDAHLGIRESALNAAGAAVRLAEDTAHAAGQTLTAEQKASAFKGELQKLAAQAEGPSRDAILALANSIDAVPNSKTIEVFADTWAAEQRIAALQRRLNTLEYASLSAQDAPYTPGAQRAHGGPVSAGRTYLVGEKRPELFVPQVNGRIIPRVPAGWGTETSGGVVIHQTIHPAEGMNERDLGIIAARETAWAANR